jgi:hypothetical protein
MGTQSETLELWLVQRRLADLVGWRTFEHWSDADESAYVSLGSTEAELPVRRG